MMNKLEYLFPSPKQLTIKKEYLALPKDIWIVINNQSKIIFSHAQNLQKELDKKGINSTITASKTNLPKTNTIFISLIVNKSVLKHPESYELIINEKSINLTGYDKQGLFYGILTFLQILELSNHKEIPCLEIGDWPDFPSRGVMLDVSRDKVPTMETLFGLIDMLAKFKMNQLQLYMEHTFAYSGHEIVWKDASPFTGEEILILDEFCREHYIELIPNQNSFGHLHRWLIHDPYRDLAECPEGVEHPFSPKKEPFSLNPIDPQVIDFLHDLYNQLLPHFTSDYFNVGLDETFDLGECRSAEICKEKGKGVVYLEFLLKIYDLVKKQGKKMQFWADIIFEHPELIQYLPKDVIPLIWGYKADHPFNMQTQVMNNLGLSYYVCPGTSSWNSITGRFDNALANLSNAGINGLKNNAMGYLITDWGDHGHLQPLPFCYLGFLIGAGIAWNVKSAEILKEKVIIPELLNIHVFQDKEGIIGKIACDLGSAYTKIGFNPPNNSSLFLILIFSNNEFSELVLENISIEELQKAHIFIDKTIKSLDFVNMEREDAELVKQEFQWAADILKFSCDLGIARLEIGIKEPLRKIPEEKRNKLHKKLHQLIMQHKKIWLSRNRSGGLSDSIDRLKKLLQRIE
ncbi:MAG: glycoside hydrolase family 20 zincin-like fold domain-containing protein [Promethearchaeota archaeon]